MPGDNKLLKVFIKPFFTKMKPEQAVHMLNELHPEVKKKILTKGIVNIFPNNLKGFMVSSEKRMELNKKEGQPLVSLNSLREI